MSASNSGANTVYDSCHGQLKRVIKGKLASSPAYKPTPESWLSTPDWIARSRVKPFGVTCAAESSHPHHPVSNAVLQLLVHGWGEVLLEQRVVLGGEAGEASAVRLLRRGLHAQHLLNVRHGLLQRLKCRCD